MNVMDKYKEWANGVNFDLDTKAELLSIKDKPQEIRDRFYRELEFGTAGIRGVLGAGTNRMNVYVVRRLSIALAMYVKNLEVDQKTIIVGYDNRNYSKEFANEAAAIFAGYGFKVFIHNELCPVPFMSYSIRLLKSALGVLITASHNPKEYNGYKVFAQDGAQLHPSEIEKIQTILDTLDDYNKLEIFDYKFLSRIGKITPLGINIKNSYINQVKRIIADRNSLNHNAGNLKLVYTPLHGAGMNFVPKILTSLGFKDLYTVSEQMVADGNFKTVESPNPEDGSAYKMAIELAEEKGAGLIIATDPDADRTGVAVKDKDGEYVLLNGNLLGVILLDYIIKCKKARNRLSDKAFVVSTVVSTRMTEEICKVHGIEYIDVFTGFKYIGGAVTTHEALGKDFVFAFEESYGYLPGNYARDKDAVASSVLVAELAAYYQSKDMTLLDAIEEVFKEYGYYHDAQVSIFLHGEEGLKKSAELMANLREIKDRISSIKLEYMIDYSIGKKYIFDEETSEEDIDFDRSNVLYYNFGQRWAAIRPSGTEPKVKIYFGAKGDDLAKAMSNLDDLKNSITDKIKEITM